MPRRPSLLASRVPIGWREWIALPSLGVERLCAKIDTGARTSALHVEAMHPVRGEPELLDIVLFPREGAPLKKSRVRVAEWIRVRNSGGQEELRPVIRSALVLGEHRLRVRISLTDRDGMRCPVLLGRSALQQLFLIVPEARHLLGEPRLLRGPRLALVGAHH